MNLRSALLAIWALLGAGAWSGSASAQLADPATGALARTSGYRDGTAWVEVARVGLRRDGRTDVRCTRGTHRFEAVLGRDALVQLASRDDAVRIFARAGVSAHSLGRSQPIYRVNGAATEDGLELAARLARLPGVVRAMPDLALARVRTSVSIPPNDEHYSAQWYLDRIAIEGAWRLTTGARATSIVVVDNGCDMDHPDLRGAYVGGRDVRDGDDDPSPTAYTDGNGHGTACAGIIAARADNGVGIAGVCPECTLHCVRLLDDSDPPIVPLSADIAAFNYAFDVGAAVVSNSWGFEQAIEVPDLLASAIDNVARHGRGGLGAVVVFSAGNDDRELAADEITALPGVLTVGAINNFDEAAPFSNRGAQLDLAAPTGTYTTDISGADGDEPGDYTKLFGGTSAACPVVAGIAGLVLSADPELTSEQVAARLVATARPAPYATPDDEGHDLTYGYGIVDPEAALRSTLGLPAVDEPASTSGGCRAASARGTSTGPCDAAWLALATLLAMHRSNRRPGARPFKPR